VWCRGEFDPSSEQAKEVVLQDQLVSLVLSFLWYLLVSVEQMYQDGQPAQQEF
jgi:hypothetical protein